VPLTLIRPAPELGASAYHMEWDGTRVFAVIEPSVDAERGRELAASTIGAQGIGKWPLLSVEPFEHGSAWLYPFHGGSSLVPMVDGALLPLRTSLDLLTILASHLQASTDVHPGPRPEDVLVDAEGAVSLVGWTAPSGPGVARIAPGHGSPQATQVYRLGVLAAELLSGTSPLAQPTPEAHAAMIRRAMSRILSRPGPMVPDVLKEWLEASLVFNPANRPPLDGTAALLKPLVDALQGPSLREWCAAELQNAKRQHPKDPTGTTMPHAKAPRPDPRASHRTFSDGELPRLDDPTAESAGGAPERVNAVELGAIPVTVGPPAEVARRRPTLPADLFSQDGEVSPPKGPEPAPDRRLAVVILFLMLAVCGLLAYLFG
jgi:hypothetical protein